MQPHLDRQAATGRTGVAAIGVAQEFQRVFTAATGAVRAEGGAPHFSWSKADRRVTAYYFYLWDEDFGPGFIKICAYFPLSLIHISEPTRRTPISYAVFCLKKKKKYINNN